MWEYRYEVTDDSNFGYGIKNGDTFTFVEGCEKWDVKWRDNKGKDKSGVGYSMSIPWTGAISNPKTYEDGCHKLVYKRVHIPDTCEPYMYNTNDDLNQFKIGDTVSVKFGKKTFRVKKHFVGKTIDFEVVNVMRHKWRRPTKRLALVPVDKKDKFKKDDILFLDDYDRFECLMIDLFPVNRRPYAGWKNKEVKIKKK